MAPVCATWSPSRRKDEHKNAPPLRSQDRVMGLPGLTAKDQIKVSQANKIVERCYQIAIQCILNNVSFAIENRYRSLMWRVKEFLHSTRLPGVHTTRFDFC